MNGLEIYGAAPSAAPFELNFGDEHREAAAALAGTVAVPLVHLGIVEAAGADAESFLQGQLSNDVRAASATRVQLTSFNSPKGRMLAVMHLWRRQTSFLLELHRSVLEPVARRLRLYVLRSKVTLADAPLAAFGVAGRGAADALAALDLPVPAGPLDCAWSDDRCVVRRQGDTPRYTLAVPAAQAEATWHALKRRAMPAGTRAWRLLEVLAGLPTVYPETQDRFVPQMCNLDELGGISFDKGCYTGQEIVARVHYRGAVKRRMARVRTQDVGLPPGAKLDLPGGGRAEIVDSVPHPDGGTLALVIAAEAH